MKRILMANDLSARSDRALRRAAMLAEQFSAELEVVTVINEALVPAMTRQNEIAASEALSQQLVAIPVAAECPVSQKVLVGPDFESIIHYADDTDADLIVLGIHRHRTREMFRGSTAERIIRYGERPVLVVKDPVRGPYRRVLIASDLSACSDSAISIAARLATGGELNVLHVLHRPFVAFLDQADQNDLLIQRKRRAKAQLEAITERLARELGADMPRTELLIREGAVPHAIYEAVEDLKPDLLAVGTHGRSGLAHALIGSVAEHVLVDCPIDVLAVKST